ncbi:DUF4436 family protein [Herbiconiux solani]|uniref:DUF4436 family protein n=1 Tax=Herbiconiux solani TaxID=661329 RepID=UPI0008240443|nr:DUF4436 family protein [Herbiconiux solani]
MSAESARPRPRRRGIAIGIAVVALIVYVAVQLLYAYGNRGSTVNSGDPADPEAVIVHLNPTSVNAVTERVSMDMTVEAPQSFHDPNDPGSVALSRGFDLLLLPVEGAQVVHFSPGDVPTISSTVFFTEGAIETYPFDTHSMEIYALAYTTEDGVRKPLKTNVEVGANVPGWIFGGSIVYEDTGATVTDETGTRPVPTVAVTVTRSASTLVFAFLLLGLLIVMPTLVLFVAIRTYRGKRKVEATLTSWMGAMLFAVVPLRGFLPGSPPIGSWIDFLVVLWVIVGLVTGLTVYVLAWNRWGTPAARERPSP